LAFCPPGGVVLDPFGGTGTTALVARGLQRTGISVDLSWDYCRVAQWRTSDPKQLAKVTPLAVTQLALDDEVAS
jgi:site-specific DNA-methyltransferase (cytosine-N4-specific)